MDEARQIKRKLYSLSRNVRNLQICVANINNILQAQPNRVALAAPPGLAAMRSTMGSLFHSTRLMQEVNELALQEGSVALELIEDSDSLLLQPVLQLYQTAKDTKPILDIAHNHVNRLHGQLNSLFVATVTFCPVVEPMIADAARIDARIAVIKRIMNRIAGQAFTGGLPGALEKRLRMLKPQLAVVDQEIQDIGSQLALLMGKMNKLVELSQRLEPVMRIAVVMDTVAKDLTPVSNVLKHLGRVLYNVKQDYSGNKHKDWLDNALAGQNLPMDDLVEAEQQLAQLAQTVAPVVEPLRGLVDGIKADVPTYHVLQGLENTLVQQQIRFQNAVKVVNVICNSFDRLFQDYKALTYAA